MENYFTIYKTTNSANGKIYIGYHETSNIFDNYLGSGSILKKAIKKYGNDNFKKEIIYVFPSREEAIAKEIEIVNDEFIQRKDTYNLKLGGEGGWDYINNILIKDDILRKDRNEKVSKIIKEVYQTGKKKGWYRADGTHILSPVNKKGRILSEETKRLISKNNFNKLKEEEIQKRLNDFDLIEKNRGYVSVLAKKWNTSHTQVRRFLKQNALVAELVDAPDLGSGSVIGVGVRVPSGVQIKSKEQ